MRLMCYSGTRSRVKLTCVIGLFVIVTVGGIGGVSQLAAQIDFGDAVRVVSDTQEPHTIDLYAHNTLPIPVYVRVEAKRISNYRASPPLPHSVAVPPQTMQHKLLSLAVIDLERSRSLAYSYTVSFSDPQTQTRHNDDYRYLFPYAHGQKFEVGQSHNGSFSHTDDGNRYAVDFTTAIGTPVHAARDGLVVFVKEDSRRGGQSSQYATDANMIIIMHSDYTLAYYVHLQHNGALVDIGAQIKAGQHIAFSGNTGISSGPHVHFDVHLPTANGGSRSIPVTFISANGEVVTRPQEGFYYYSAHPKGRPFEVVLGRSITPRSFDGYLNSIPTSQKIDFRTEMVDNTILAFCLNGTTKDIQARINVRFIGLTSDLSYPFTTAIPAGSEIFCGLFRVKQNRALVARWSITPEIGY